MADAVEAMWQDMEQETADELVRRECSSRAVAPDDRAVVLVAEGDAGLIVGDQTLIGDPTGGGSARDRRAQPRR